MPCHFRGVKKHDQPPMYDWNNAAAGPVGYGSNACAAETRRLTTDKLKVADVRMQGM